MDSEKWQQIKSILEQAIEVAPDSRREFLKKICNGDEDLRREAEIYLEFEDTEADVLEKLAHSLIVPSAFDDGEAVIGMQIGNYRVIKKLGTGGMGAVFLAERADGAFDQRVAIKIIKGEVNSSTVLRRFLNERRILAGLEHPNIARLIDGGAIADGAPYLAMEYIEGLPLDKYVNRHDLDLQSRLNLFQEICQAVAFAHKNLVIHRDLKPSNILITEDGEPKLLDFGIAKLLKTDETGDTQTRHFAFTPDYASPEQARGEKLTTATDIYSLGIILYELLTGLRPYRAESQSIGGIIKIICETEPERPSAASAKYCEQSSRSEQHTGVYVQQRTAPNAATTNPKSKTQNPKSLRGDLDNIILKALRKEPEKRYSSVEQLAEDIRRHQVGLPVSARRDTWKYRAAKFLQRNKIAAAASVLILFTLIAGLAATIYQANVAQRERAKAEQRFSDVRQLANSFLFEFHSAIEDLPGSTPARELVVKRAVEYLDKLAAESESDPSLQRELGTAYAAIGQIQGNSYHSNLGDTDGALKSYRRSLEIREKLIASDPLNRQFQNELADSHEGVGDVLYTINDLKGGLESYEKALAIREKIVAEEPENLGYRYLLANVLGKRGDISGMEGFANLGDLPTALESYRRNVGIYEELVKAAPGDERFESGYAINLYYFGMLQTITGDSKGAILGGRKSVSILEKLLAAHPNNAKYETNLMSALVFMRYPLLEEGQTAEAVENARRIVHTMEKMSSDDPKNAFARRSLGVSYNSLGICLLKDGKAREAIENHRRSLAIVEALSAADAENYENLRDFSMTRQFLAEAQMAAGDTEAALNNFRQSVSYIESQLKTGANSIQLKDDLSLSLVYIGRILAAKGDLNGAAESYQRGFPLAEEAIQNAPLNVRVKSRHALSYLEAGKTLVKANRAISANGKSGDCAYLERSLALWNEMREAKTLSATYIHRPEETAQELAKCKQ